MSATAPDVCLSGSERGGGWGSSVSVSASDSSSVPGTRARGRGAGGAGWVWVWREAGVREEERREEEMTSYLKCSAKAVRVWVWGVGGVLLGRRKGKVDRKWMNGGVCVERGGSARMDGPPGMNTSPSPDSFTQRIRTQNKKSRLGVERTSKVLPHRIRVLIYRFSHNEGRT